MVVIGIGNGVVSVVVAEEVVVASAWSPAEQLVAARHCPRYSVFP